MQQQKSGRDCRVLLGWMPRQQAVDFLLNHCDTGQQFSAGRAMDLWREYRARVEELPACRDSTTTFELTEADRREVEAFRRNNPGSGEITGFVRVDPLELQAHQLQVAADEAETVSQSDSWRDVALCPGASEWGVQWRTEQGRLIFDLPHGEFVMTAPQAPDAEMRIAPLPSYVSVARCGSRMLLVNGYHRTFAWLSLHWTGMVAGPRSRSLLFPVTEAGAFGGLAGEPRPPLLRDFFDRRLALPVRVARTARYEMRINVEIVAVPEALTRQTPSQFAASEIR